MWFLVVYGTCNPVKKNVRLKFRILENFPRWQIWWSAGRSEVLTKFHQLWPSMHFFGDANSKIEVLEDLRIIILGLSKNAFFGGFRDPQPQKLRKTWSKKSRFLLDFAYSAYKGFWCSWGGIWVFSKHEKTSEIGRNRSEMSSSIIILALECDSDRTDTPGCVCRAVLPTLHVLAH